MSQLISHIEQSLRLLNVTPSSRLLLGLSGGIDSMVLLDVLKKLHYNTTAAHVNFQLRGQESDEDASFVATWCDQHAIPFRIKTIDTRAYSNQHDLNTQLAARKIRYEWWEKLTREEGFDYIMTAHHADDAVETFFINLLRGTGIKGLQGIPEQREMIIRPMIHTSRSDIESYARENQIPFRNDSSNDKEDYHRNRIRHQLIPLLKEMVPGFNARMDHNLLRIQKEWQSWEAAYEHWQKNNLSQHQDGTLITLGTSQESFLLKWLETQLVPWNLAYDFIFAPSPETGQILQLKDFQLSRTVDGYYFGKLTIREEIEINGTGIYPLDHMTFTIQQVDHAPLELNSHPDTVFVAADCFSFPLTIRSVIFGDTFQPLGMNGKTKKLQDLMVDRKLAMHEKALLRLLTSSDHILWVMGIQLDERSRIVDREKPAYKLTLTMRELP